VKTNDLKKGITYGKIAKGIVSKDGNPAIARQGLTLVSLHPLILAKKTT
jgi:hypothetical protein